MGMFGRDGVFPSFGFQGQKRQSATVFKTLFLIVAGPFFIVAKPAFECRNLQEYCRWAPLKLSQNADLRHFLYFC